MVRTPNGRKAGGTGAENNEDDEALEKADALFTEAGSVTIASLLHLLRLTGAELVLARADLDPTPFEQAIRAKLDQFTSPTANQEARAAGIAFARHLVEQVLKQIRAQAEVKKSLHPPGTQAEKPASPPAHPPSKLLN